MAMSGLSGMTLPYTPTSYPSYYGQAYSSLYARPTSPAEPPPPPDYSSINPDVATKAIERLVLSGLKNAGFDGSDSGAMKRLEAEVVECMFPFRPVEILWIAWLIPDLDVKMLFERAHEVANLANRSGPIVTDLLLACKERNVDLEQLNKVAGGPRGKKRKSLGSYLPSTLLRTRMQLLTLSQISTTSKLRPLNYLNLHPLCHACLTRMKMNLG